MHMPNVPGILFLLVIGILLFGPAKLPQLGRAVGITLKEFKLATQGITASQPDPEESQRKQIESEVRQKMELEIRAQIEREMIEKERLQKEKQQGTVM